MIRMMHHQHWEEMHVSMKYTCLGTLANGRRGWLGGERHVASFVEVVIAVVVVVLMLAKILVVGAFPRTMYLFRSTARLGSSSW